MNGLFFMPRFANTLGRIVGYHGCDRKVAELILHGKSEVHVSENDYDWLGKGAYFWVDSPLRAFKWAQDAKRRDERSPPTHRPAIKTPYVLGAFINTGLCLNLLDFEVIQEIRAMHDLYRSKMSPNEKTPENTLIKNNVAIMRRLDCSVINYLHFERARDRLPSYDTALGMFIEGPPVYEGAGFNSETHVQIAVLNPAASIIGYFRPRYLDV